MAFVTSTDVFVFFWVSSITPLKKCYTEILILSSYVTLKFDFKFDLSGAASGVGTLFVRLLSLPLMFLWDFEVYFQCFSSVCWRSNNWTTITRPTLAGFFVKDILSYLSDGNLGDQSFQKAYSDFSCFLWASALSLTINPMLVKGNCLQS